jgi:copper chaperone CopZ
MLNSKSVIKLSQTLKIEGMTCAGCAAKVEYVLGSVKGVDRVQVNLEKAEAEIYAQSKMAEHAFVEALAPYKYRLVGSAPVVVSGFWQDGSVWKRASFNTLNCLIGCSLGDFGMIIYLQAYHPGVSMTTQMVLAILAGLATSVLFETTLLRLREKFSWSAALRTAFSMSFISMVAMEVVMNATDFMLTGGKAAFGNPMYWTALVVAMVAGFLAPLPYNYYKLKKYNKACH